MNPYFINEPAAISFSGGRTSAYMLYRILEAHDGKLPDDVKVTFANTGKEMPETLDFVQACSDNWGVDIVWLELEDIKTVRAEGLRNVIEREYKTVCYESASRNGEPFTRYLMGVDAIPNAVQRTCTGNLKMRAIKWYLENQGFEMPWLQMVGIRADETRRAVKIHNTVADGAERFCPLWVDGITAKDVGDFWANNNFDLRLPNNGGVTDWGNCDLCFLKGASKRASIIRERPDLADWWIAAEASKGQRFRPDQTSYAQMKLIATDQGQLFDLTADETIPCFCGD